MMRENEHVSIFRMLARDGGIEVGIEHNRDQSHQNPRPRANGVVGNVEPENGKKSLTLILGAEDALSNVTATAGLGAGIPECPPLQPEINQQSDHRKRPPGLTAKSVGKVRK